MDIDKLDFLDGETPAEPAVTPAADLEAALTEPTPEGPTRGPDGRFVAAQPLAEPQEIAPTEPEPEPAPAAPTIPPGYVPVSVVQELRQELRALRQPPPTQAPDLYEDPQGHAEHLSQSYAAQMHQQKLGFSQQMATLRHGEDVTKQVHDWASAKCDADPLFNQRMFNSPDPYEVAVQEWKREQVLEKLQPADIDRLLALAAGQQQTPQPAALVQPAPQPSPPPRSMAAAPNAGGAKPGAQPVGPHVAFDTVFKD